MSDRPLTKREERRLIRAYQRVVLGGEFPNPDRAGCPDSKILEAMALRKLQSEQVLDWIEHLGTCSPCFREYTQFREDYKRLRFRRIASMAACVVAVAAVVVWLAVNHLVGPGHLQSVTLDLFSRETLRGPEGNANPPLQLTRGYLSLTVYLPAGNEPGVYDVQVVREPGQPIWSAQGEATFENYKATLRVKVDLRRFNPGSYLLAFRRQDRSWTYIPLVLK
jgi:hypothetical protein